MKTTAPAFDAPAAQVHEHLDEVPMCPCVHHVWASLMNAEPTPASLASTSTSSSSGALLQGTLPALDDDEGLRVPSALPSALDAHVHLFPERVFDALWAWFEKYGWPIRYRLQSPAIIPFLQSRGVEQMVALHYAHKPNMASTLNAYMAELTNAHAGVVGTATVFPGEDNARGILEDAFDLGLKGVKLHCHVQRFAPDADDLHDVYAACEARGMPLVMHAGREPQSPAYGVDIPAICSAERVDAVLTSFPHLKLVVPHLGADEFAAYFKLMEKHENLHVDTTMMLGGYFPIDVPLDVFAHFSDRVLYGSDFPSLPYAWDRELKHLVQMGLDEETLHNVSRHNAQRLFFDDDINAHTAGDP